MCSHVGSSAAFKMVVVYKITSRTFCFDFTRIGTRVTCFPYYEIQVKQTQYLHQGHDADIGIPDAAIWWRYNCPAPRAGDQCRRVDSVQGHYSKLLPF